MPRYDFQSPTAAAGQGIQDILTKRREEARQALLDEITAKNAEASRAGQEESIKTSKENRARQLFLDSQEGREMGDDLSGLPPELLAEYQRRSLLGPNPNPQPSVSTETDFGGGEAPVVEGQPSVQSTASHSNYYVGNKDQRKTERIRKNIGGVISQMGDPNRSHIENMASLWQASEDPTAPAGLYTAAQPREPKVFVDAYGNAKPIKVDGKSVMAGLGDDPIVRGTYPPQERRDTGTVYGPALDNNGQPIPGKVIMTQNGQLRVVDLPEGVSGVGPRPSNANPNNLILLPEGTSQKIADLRARATPGEGFGGRRPTDLDVEKYYQGVTSAIQTAKVSDPSVRAAVQAIIDTWGQVDPDSGDSLEDTRSAEELADELAQSPGATPREVEEFKRLLLIVRGY
jgi:hypothetical protein